MINLVVYGVARAADVDFTVRFSDTDSWSTITAGQIAASTLVSVLVGFGVALAALRWARRLIGWVRATGAVVAVASVGAPLSVTALDDPAKPLLALMHLVAGAAFLYATRQR